VTYEYGAYAQDPAVIDAEIAAGMEAGSLHLLINNFTENLSGGSYRSQIEQLGWQDRTMTDSRYEPGSEDNPHSALAYTKTWSQFFEDVNRAVEESGLDPTELARLQALADETPGVHGEVREARDRYALPAYRLLRIWGYSSFDLRR